MNGRIDGCTVCQRCDKNLRIFIHECGTPQEDDWTCVVGGWEDIALQDSATEVQDAAAAAAAAAKSLQLCLTLWDPIDGSPPGSSVHRILQARILEWRLQDGSPQFQSSAADLVRLSHFTSWSGLSLTWAGEYRQDCLPSGERDYCLLRSTLWSSCVQFRKTWEWADPAAL